MEKIEIVNIYDKPDGILIVNPECIMGVSYCSDSESHFSRTSYKYMLLTTVGNYGISEETFNKFKGEL